MALIVVSGMHACGKSEDTSYLLAKHPEKVEVSYDVYHTMQDLDKLIDQEEITSPEYLDFFIKNLQDKGWDVSISNKKTNDPVRHYVCFDH
jgi:hypothetical protein